MCRWGSLFYYLIFFLFLSISIITLKRDNDIIRNLVLFKKKKKGNYPTVYTGGGKFFLGADQRGQVAMPKISFENFLCFCDSLANQIIGAVLGTGRPKRGEIPWFPCSSVLQFTLD